MHHLLHGSRLIGMLISSNELMSIRLTSITKPQARILHIRLRSLWISSELIVLLSPIDPEYSKPKSTIISLKITIFLELLDYGKPISIIIYSKKNTKAFLPMASIESMFYNKRVFEIRRILQYKIKK